MSKNRALSGSIALGKGMALAAIAAMFLQGCGGCSGFDVAALSLDGRVINYSKKLSEEPTPTAAIIYGKLSPKSSTAISGNSLNGEYKAIFQELDNIVELADNDAQKNTLSAWTNTIKAGAKQKIEPLLIPATTDSGEAVKLANELVPLLKDGGQLETGRATALGSIPDGLKGNFNQIYDSLEKSVGRLYQMAVVTANRLEQDKARQKVAEISEGLDELRTMLDERDDLMAARDRQDAFNALVNGKVYIKALDVPLSDMSTNIVVESNLKNFFNNVSTIFNGDLKNNFYDKAATVAIKAEIKPKYDALVAQAAELVQLAAAYKPIERATKENADPKLGRLIAKAFSAKEGIAPVLGTSLDQLTDINHLTEALARADVVVLEDNDNSLNMVLALASSVASNVAQLYGLPDASNVVGPDHERISKDKVDFAMDDGQFDTYLKNLGEKIRAESLESGAQKNIYVVFADLYPKDAKVNLLIQGLAQDKGKVVIITKNLQNYKGELFSPHGLSLAETILVADEMFKDENLSVDRTLVSDRLARFYTAFGHVTLSNLTPVVKDVAAKLRDPRAKKDDKGIQAIVIGSLASKKIHVGAQRSVLLSDSVKDAEKKLREDPQYYQQAASGGGGGRGHADVLLSEMASIKAERASANKIDVARQQALLELENIKSAIEAMQKVSDEKHAEAEQAKLRLKVALFKKKSEIEKALDQIALTAKSCTVRASSPFADTVKQQLLGLDFMTTPIAEPAKSIIEGKPDITAMNVTSAACLITDENIGKAVESELVKAKAEIASLIDNLEQDSLLCLNEAGFTAMVGMESCLKTKINTFEVNRKNLIQSSVLPAGGYINTIAKKVPYFPGASNQFWKTAAAVTLVPSPLVPSTFAAYISLANAGLSSAQSNIKAAHMFLNRSYYIKALLDIFGSNGGVIAPLNNSIFDFGNKASNDPNRFVFVNQLLADFEDDDALMVQARREINKEYKFFLADRIAHMINKELVGRLFNDVIKPFWTQNPAELQKYDSNISLKQVRDQMVSFVKEVNDLTEAIRQDFIKKGDGDIVEGDITYLYALLTQLQSFSDAAQQLKTYVDATGTTNPKINAYISDSTTMLSPQLQSALGSAYDLARYNEPKFDGTLPSGSALRRYTATENWHPKYNATNPPIKHPLDP